MIKHQLQGKVCFATRLQLLLYFCMNSGHMHSHSMTRLRLQVYVTYCTDIMLPEYVNGACYGCTSIQYDFHTVLTISISAIVHNPRRHGASCCLIFNRNGCTHACICIIQYLSALVLVHVHGCMVFRHKPFFDAFVFSMPSHARTALI